MIILNYSMRILFILLCLFTSCARNPVTGKSEWAFIPESQEISLGEQNYSLMQQAEGGILTVDPEILDYVRKVGNKIASASDRSYLPFEFVVLNNSIPNAWALPGGKIAINRGLLTALESEAQLAALLSHEIVHSAARHVAQEIERSLLMQTGLIGLKSLLKGHRYEDLATQSGAIGTGLVHLKYSRNAELQADRYGIKYTLVAGYDPQAAVELQKIFLDLQEKQDVNWLLGWLSTHPPAKKRVKANIQPTEHYLPGGFRGQKEYQQAIASLTKNKKAYEALDQGSRLY